MENLGPRGEDIAVQHLQKKGYKILHRNYKTVLGEADIIGKDGDTIVFVEVKARSSDAFGQPFEAVDHRKQEKLKRIALYYMKHKDSDAPVRFDIVSIVASGGKEEVNHIVGAF